MLLLFSIKDDPESAGYSAIDEPQKGEKRQKRTTLETQEAALHPLKACDADERAGVLARHPAGILLWCSTPTMSEQRPSTRPEALRSAALPPWFAQLTPEPDPLQRAQRPRPKMLDKRGLVEVLVEKRLELCLPGGPRP